MEENRKLLQQYHPEHESSEEEWSGSEEEESIYSSSYYSDDSDSSSIPEWDSSINEQTGELFYIECHPFVSQNVPETNKTTDKKPFQKNATRQSTRGKFLRLIRRRESKRYSKRHPKNQETETTSKVKFFDFQDGEEREVLLNISIKNRGQPEQNTLLIESILGINVSTLSDGNRVMVAGFLPDSAAKYDKNIKIGDWLKSINDMEVTYQKLNSVLEKIIDQNHVLIKLQRVAGVDVTKDPPINELKNQSPFVRQLSTVNFENKDAIMLKLSEYPMGLIFLDMDKLTENGQEFEDIIYGFPRPFNKNLLCISRGVFITLNHLILDLTKTQTKVSSISYKNKLCHISYKLVNQNILLLLLPESYATATETLMILDEIIRVLEFLYDTLNLAFETESYRMCLDHFFARFFVRKISGGDWLSMEKFLEQSPEQLFSTKNFGRHFEDILPAVQTLNLPDEAKMQIDDALTELEACDYRDWNDDPLDCQRLFTMLGSAWYHAGYLLESHLIYEDLVDVHSYCRQQELLCLSKMEPIKNMVLWKQVFPTSCRKKGNNFVPEGGRYLLIIGSAKDLLAVIMEAGGCTEPIEENCPPDAFYVEEAQATLAHLQELGLPELADRFISLNPGPQCTIPNLSSNKKKLDLIGFARRDLSQTRKQEVTSILKRRGSDLAHPLNHNSLHSLVDEVGSEDSGSQGGGSEQSELSLDESIGRRAADKKYKYDSNDDDSDNADKESSRISNSSFDISELRQNLLTDTQDINPIQITSGSENVLFHFVQFDSTEGILLAPPECRMESQTLATILDKFRQCSLKIHSLFQNTIRFKDMSGQDMAKSVMNKSLIAIKEHGFMFECPFLDEKDGKKNKIQYWIIGRIFFTPHVREVYVCYNDAIPQNIIELAFKMNLNFPEND